MVKRSPVWRGGCAGGLNSRIISSGPVCLRVWSHSAAVESSPSAVYGILLGGRLRTLGPSWSNVMKRWREIAVWSGDSSHIGANRDQDRIDAPSCEPLVHPGAVDLSQIRVRK